MLLCFPIALQLWSLLKLIAKTVKLAIFTILSVIILSYGCQSLIRTDEHDVTESKSATQLSFRDLGGVPVIRISGTLDRVGADRILRSLPKTAARAPKVALFVIAEGFSFRSWS